MDPPGAAKPHLLRSPIQLRDHGGWQKIDRQRPGTPQRRRLAAWIAALFGDLTRITRVLSFPDEAQRAEAAARLLEHATTVEAVLNRRVSWEQAADAFADAFRQALNLVLEPAELSRRAPARRRAGHSEIRPSLLD